MTSNLRRKRALVVGGAGTLGSAVAAQLADRGYDIAIADKDADRGQELAAALNQRGAVAKFFLVDVTQPAAWLELRAVLQRDWLHLDLFVSAAGILVVDDFDQTPLDRHTEVVTVNLLGTINGCHALVPWLASSPDGGHLVLVASCAGFLTMPWSGSYNASKAGVLALAETLAAEYGPQMGVTVAAPAFFPSELFEKAQIRDAALARLVSRLTQNCPLSADDLARQLCEAVRKRRLYVVLPKRTHWLWWLKRMFPSWYVRRLGRDGRRYRARSQATLNRQHGAGSAPEVPSARQAVSGSDESGG